MGLFSGETVREIKRLRQITNVLFKHGLGYAIERMQLKSHLTFHKRLQKEAFSKPITSLPVRLRQVLNNLGGTFVKLGQMMSLRHDLVPDEYCKEFEKLQDNVKPLPFNIIKKVVEAELGAPLRHLFKDFSKTPLASASVGQVHKAKLKTGEIVAVKVQRPRIRQVFESDIKLLYRVVKMINRHFPEAKEYNLKMIIEEFEIYTKKEMDYMLEARNIEIFHNNFKENPNIVIPKVFWKLTRRKVLTMSYVSGVKISDIKDFGKMHSDKNKVIDSLLHCMMDQIFDYRVFHGDPHPGNVLLVGYNKIAFLDFGIVGRFLPEMVEEIENVLIGLIEQDLDMVVNAYMKIGLSKTDSFDPAQFKEDLVARFGEYYGAELQQINFATFFSNTFEMARKYKIYLPLNFTLLAKALMTLQGYCAEYAPKFNLTDYIEPRVREMIKERVQPKYLFQSVKKMANSLRNFTQTFPSDLTKLMRTIIRAKVDIDVKHDHVTDFALEVDRSSNRLTFGLIIAALIVGTSIIMQAQIGPMVRGYPLLAYVGMFFIGVLSLMLAISIFRERRVKKGGEPQ